MWRRKLHIERLEDRRVLAADFNGDETVDQFDLREWRSNFGMMQVSQMQGDSDGDADVDGNDFLEWQREGGAQSDNLIVYRPQGIYHPTDPSIAPKYDPFPQRPVSGADEFSNTLGPGIRINHDDDDLSGVKDVFDVLGVLQENDLIEVRVQSVLGADMVLIPDFS